jgi:16S rRNA U516 pseudouridylate synthase RsuA-like enzyme
MRSEAEWTEEIKRILRAEMVRRGITYDELAKKLAAIGVELTPAALRMTINRGRFRAILLVQCLTAMGCRSLRLTDPEEDR